MWNSNSHAGTKSSPTQAERKISPFERLYVTSVAAQKGESDAIDNLADAILTDFVPLEIPADLRGAVKTRLVRAELNYRGGGRGITEADIARTINNLVDKFEAPQYAKTSSRQVRYLRLSMMGVFPEFSRQKPETTKGRQGNVPTSISPWLSPLEASFLTALMLQQKLLNEDYQVEPKDWGEHLQRKNLEMWRTYHEHRGVVNSSSAPLRAVPLSSKSAEIRQSIEAGASTMTSADVADIVTTVLDGLHIDK
jgi:hypothetical protein